MTICLPLNNSNGLSSLLSDDFVTARFIMIYDTAAQNAAIYTKSDLLDKYENESLIECLKEEGLGALISVSIKVMALKALKENGIPVYKTTALSAEKAIAQFTEKKLDNFSTDDCSAGGCSGSCDSCSTGTCGDTK